MLNKPEKLSEEERLDQMIYGFNEDGIKLAFGDDTFDLSFAKVDYWQELDRSFCGVARRYLPKIKRVAPIATYGVTVRGIPENNRPGAFEDTMDLRAHSPSLQNSVALYKQRKVDAQGLEYFVLSIGVSGEVYSQDLQGDLQIVHANATLNRAAYRNYAKMVEIDSGLYVTNGQAMNDGWPLQDYAMQNSQSMPFMYLRDGKKKPGYEGAAYIGAVYVVATPVDTIISFTDDDYEFVDWFTLSEIQMLAYTQKALVDIRKENPNIAYLHADPKVEIRMGKLWEIPLEPWSLSLCIDDTCEFEHMVNSYINQMDQLF